MSSIEPKSKRLFDTDLKVFKEYLEMRHPLCDSFKLTVRDVLRRQAVWLTCYKMLFFRRKPIQMLVGELEENCFKFFVQNMTTVKEQESFEKLDLDEEMFITKANNFYSCGIFKPNLF